MAIKIINHHVPRDPRYLEAKRFSWDDTGLFQRIAPKTVSSTAPAIYLQYETTIATWIKKQGVTDEGFFLRYNSSKNVNDLTWSKKRNLPLFWSPFRKLKYTIKFRKGKLNYDPKKLYGKVAGVFRINPFFGAKHLVFSK